MPDRARLLELALKGLEADRSKIDNEIAQLRMELSSGHRSGHNEAQVVSPTGEKKRTMSAAARKKISEGMKRRYAQMKKAMAKSG